MVLGTEQIKALESGIYTGKNVDGEKVILLRKKGGCTGTN